MEKVSPGIFKENDELYTLNANPGERVYGEKLLHREGDEYRFWDHERSKAAAAMMKGVELDLSGDEDVLYLGAASGTTVSHFSDVLQDGFIYAVEYSETVMRDLLKLAEARENIAPVLGNARKPGDYTDLVDEVDVVYQDVSQRDQVEILEKNCDRFLEENGKAMIAVKARSISSDPVEEVLEDVRERLQDSFVVVEETRLEPFEKDHLFLVLEKR